jgi:hypothetical protein
MDKTAWTVLPAAQGGTVVESDESSQAGLLHHIEIYCMDLKVEDPDCMKVEPDAPDEDAHSAQMSKREAGAVWMKG